MSKAEDNYLWILKNQILPNQRGLKRVALLKAIEVLEAAAPTSPASDLALLEACDSRFGSLTLYGRGSVHLILEQLKSYVEGTAAMSDSGRQIGDTFSDLEQPRAAAPLSESDLLSMEQQIAAADAEIRALNNGKKWRMSIPAKPDSDSDLVISMALYVASELLKRQRMSLPVPPQEHP